MSFAVALYMKKNVNFSEYSCSLCSSEVIRVEKRQHLLSNVAPKVPQIKDLQKLKVKKLVYKWVEHETILSFSVSIHTEISCTQLKASVLNYVIPQLWLL